jgi:hypothetical protein
MVVARLNKVASFRRSRKESPLIGVSDEEIARRQAARNTAAREKLLSEFGALSGAKTAAQWKREGLIFTVPYQGRNIYPTFQFDAQGCPRPVVAEVLATLGQQGRGWQLALWFTSANGWLGGRRPVDILDTDPAAISEAARHEASDLVF